MPYKITKVSIGYQVKNTKTGEIKSKGTTKTKAENQVKLLERFMKPKQKGRGVDAKIEPEAPEPRELTAAEEAQLKITEAEYARRAKMLVKARKVLGSEANDLYYHPKIPGVPGRKTLLTPGYSPAKIDVNIPYALQVRARQQHAKNIENAFLEEQAKRKAKAKK